MSNEIEHIKIEVDRLAKRFEASEDRLTSSQANLMNNFQEFKHTTGLGITGLKADLNGLGGRVSKIEGRVDTHADKIERITQQLTIAEQSQKRFADDMTRFESLINQLSLKAQENSNFVKIATGVSLVLVPIFSVIVGPLIVSFFGGK